MPFLSGALKTLSCSSAKAAYHDGRAIFPAHEYDAPTAWSPTHRRTRRLVHALAEGAHSERGHGASRKRTGGYSVDGAAAWRAGRAPGVSKKHNQGKPREACGGSSG